MVAVGAQAIEALRARHRRHVLPRHLERCTPAAGHQQRLLRGGRGPPRARQRADRVVGLASREKLGTTAQFGIAPATALTDLATEPDVPAELLEPYAELGIHLVR